MSLKWLVSERRLAAILSDRLKGSENALPQEAELASDLSDARIMIARLREALELGLLATHLLQDGMDHEARTQAELEWRLVLADTAPEKP